MKRVANGTTFQGHMGQNLKKQIFGQLYGVTNLQAAQTLIILHAQT